MPRTKLLQHYPDRYQEILRECGLQGKRVEVQMESLKQALSLRGHWYAFVGSLKAHNAATRRELAKGRLPTSGESDLFQLEALAPTVMLQIEQHSETVPPVVVFQSREHSWQARLLRQARVTGGDPAPPVATLDSVAARLMAQQPRVASPCPVCGEPFEAGELTTHEPCRSIAAEKGGV